MLEYLKRPKFIVGLLTAIAGIEISLLMTKLPRLIGIIFLAIGLLLIYLDYRSLKTASRGAAVEVKPKRTTKTKRPSLSQRLIRKISFDGRLIPFFWVFGILLIAGDLLLAGVYGNSSFGSFDVILFAFGATLILYAPLLKRYPRELDFLVVFLALLTVVLIIPLVIVGNLSGNIEDLTSQQDLVYVLLTAPLSGILSVLGVESSAHGLFLSFTTANGDQLTIGILASCAGIYSFGIFLSAFLAFVLSEFTVFTKRIAVLLIIGSFLTYAANLLRMTVVVLAGYYNGMGVQGDPAPFTLLWTHAYAGEIIFICWVALFWWIAFNYFAPKEGGDDMIGSGGSGSSEGTASEVADARQADEAIAPKALDVDEAR